MTRGCDLAKVSLPRVRTHGNEVRRRRPVSNAKAIGLNRLSTRTNDGRVWLAAAIVGFFRILPGVPAMGPRLFGKVTPAKGGKIRNGFGEKTSWKPGKIRQADGT